MARKSQFREGLGYQQAVDGTLMDVPSYQYEYLPSFEEVWEEELQSLGLTPRQKDYFANKIYSEFMAKNPGAREMWWDAVESARRAREQETKRIKESRLWELPGSSGAYGEGGFATPVSQDWIDMMLNNPIIENMDDLIYMVQHWGDPTMQWTEEWLSPEQISELENANMMEKGYREAFAKEVIKPRKYEGETLQDPLRQFIKKYPFMQEWGGLTPARRGERTSWLGSQWLM